MFNSCVYSNIEPNSYKAGEDIAIKIKSNIEKPKIVFIYTNESHDHKKLKEGIKAHLGDVNIIGNTSSKGIITHDGYLFNENGFVGAMAIYDSSMDVKTSLISNNQTEHNSLQAYTLGLKLGQTINKYSKQATQPLSFFHMVSTPGEEESYLDGISQQIGRHPLFGGSAADNSVQGMWTLFTQDDQTSNGAAAAVFFTHKKIVNQYVDGYREMEHTGLITKMDGKRTIIEINNRPALLQYAEWLGEETNDLFGEQLLTKSILNPIGVKDITGSLTAIRHPLVGNKDMSMSIGNDICDGSSIIHMSATKHELIETVRHTIRDLFQKIDKDKVGALHLVHCAGRRLEIDTDIQLVHKILQQECVDIPYIVEFTFGEYGFNECSANTCGGLMLSFTAFEK